MFFRCHTSEKTSEMEQWKSEIIAVEKAFNDMAQKDGLTKAFEHYAAENGAIRRGKKIIKGKKAIGEWYKKDVRPNESLSWSPTFVDVSKYGDMAYTYGDYTFTYQDSLGTKKENKGIFHTVWKRQQDGSWKFVYD
ncbi:YybH family protein [Winogradskyella flava]|uniref:Nuclear transport factor 2 family protein n=1 Tax=Winogradskyella flava TaxID=1884876 RepID=A0A842IR43_9FLAO|nr:DUF4440 domain-containing protein [Winogradskyella flava]MBC2845185.1 nuclear transport factor 2 family protein [Winogradskyella flava]